MKNSRKSKLVPDRRIVVHIFRLLCVTCAREYTCLTAPQLWLFTEEFLHGSENSTVIKFSHPFDI